MFITMFIEAVVGISKHPTVYDIKSETVITYWIPVIQNLFEIVL